MGRFALRGGVYASSVSDSEALLPHQSATEVLVVLDDSGEHAMTSPMVNAVTETEQRRDGPCERALRTLLPSMSENDEDVGRLRALTEDSLRTDKSVRLRATVGDLNYIIHDESDILRIQPEAVWSWLGTLNDIRLSLADELGLSDSHNARRTEELALSEPTGKRLRTVTAIYMLITWWQDSFLEAVNNSQ